MSRTFLISGIIIVLFCGVGFGEENPNFEKQLKILSWNIKMLPPPYGWFLNSNERAENIAEFLLDKEGYDIILFQEGFSNKIRSKIYQKLHAIYPYQIEPHDQTVFFKTNSGLWAISRLPLKLIDDITFSMLKGWDWMSSKGAKLYSVEKEGQKMYVINTHLQADYETKLNRIRKNQYEEIRQKLIIPNVTDETPLIFCGDLNISTPSHLHQLLERLHLENGPLSGKLQVSTLGHPQQLLDYILLRSGTFKFHRVSRQLLHFPLEDIRNQMNHSDHFPLQAIFMWKE